jgi:hypothetical protein
MRFKEQFITLLMLVFVVVIGMNAYAATYNLSLEATTDGTNVPNPLAFERADEIYLNVVLDNAAGIAGAAFTLTYDSSKLIGPATDADGLPVDAADIISIFPFTNFRVNSLETGKIYLAGVGIDVNDGGGQYASGARTLFTVKFYVRVDAPLGTHTDTFGLAQTEIFNLEAGYGTDNSDPLNGTYEEEDGDTKDSVPILVSAVSSPFTSHLSDDFADEAVNIGPLPTLGITITDCVNSDTDSDGLSDCVESNTGTYIDANDTGTDPNNDDSDGDGFLDGVETNTGTYVDPNNTGTDPNNPDSDGDGFNDGADANPNSPDDHTVDLVLSAGWHIISLPVTPNDPDLTNLFPDAIVAYKFEGTYQSVATLEPGTGYWIKLTTGGDYLITGSHYPQYSTALDSGWHIMGGVNGTATPTTTPPGDIIIMYDYEGTYLTTTEFVAGKGYWVKIRNGSTFNVSIP